MKPLCEVCGDRHETYQAHVFPRSASRVTSPVVEEKPVASTKVVVDTASGGTGAVVDMANARTRDRHRKTAARREYLRLKQRESRARRRVAGT